MSSNLRFALVVTLTLTGCQPQPTSTATSGAPDSGTAATNTTSPSALATTGDPKADFMAAFRQAHANKDIEQMLQLYCWDGVDAEMRETVRGNVSDELRQPVAQLDFIEPAPGNHGPRVEGGIRWKSNLEVVALAKAKFAPAPAGTGFNVSEAEYTLGKKDGQYRITVPIREP